MERAGPRAYASRALVPPRGPGLTHHVHAASPLHATRGHQLATEGEAGSAADTPTNHDRITLAPPEDRPSAQALIDSIINFIERRRRKGPPMAQSEPPSRSQPSKHTRRQTR